MDVNHHRCKVRGGWFGCFGSKSGCNRCEIKFGMPKWGSRATSSRGPDFRREVCLMPLQVLLLANNRLMTLSDELGQMQQNYPSCSPDGRRAESADTQVAQQLTSLSAAGSLASLVCSRCFWMLYKIWSWVTTR